MLLQQQGGLFLDTFLESGPPSKARYSCFPTDALCRNIWLTAGRSTMHAGVGPALADVTLVAFSFACASQSNCQP